jgi:hypothetical protein
MDDARQTVSQTVSSLQRVSTQLFRQEKLLFSNMDETLVFVKAL